MLLMLSCGCGLVYCSCRPGRILHRRMYCCLLGVWQSQTSKGKGGINIAWIQFLLLTVWASHNNDNLDTHVKGVVKQMQLSVDVHSHEHVAGIEDVSMVVDGTAHLSARLPAALETLRSQQIAGAGAELRTCSAVHDAGACAELGTSSAVAVASLFRCEASNPARQYKHSSKLVVRHE